MKEDDALVSLLTKAGIASTPYWRNLWFPNCRLIKNWIVCLDAQTARTIARLFLPQLRKVMSDIEIRTDAGVNYTAQYGRKPDSILKKEPPKRAYRGEAPEVEKAVDLLDE